MNEVMIEQIVKEVLNNISSSGGTTTNTIPKTQSAGMVSCKDYPLGEKRSELIKTPSGKSLDSIKLDDIVKGNIKSDDLRITPETLELQAQVADSVGRTALARNLRRAAELTRVPDERVLEIYNALRPYRSTKAELIAIANELEQKYSATILSHFVLEAADVCEQRNRLKRD